MLLLAQTNRLMELAQVQIRATIDSDSWMVMRPSCDADGTSRYEKGKDDAAQVRLLFWGWLLPL
jgi:hypothetical protein